MPRFDEGPPCQELSAFRDRYRWILDGLPTPVFALDREGRVLVLNPACAALIAATQDDVLGRVLADLVIAPDERDRWCQMFEEVLQQHPPCTRHLRWRASDGSVALTCCTLSAVTTPEHVDLVVGTLAVLPPTDNQDPARQHAPCKYEAILHALPDLVFRLGADGVFREFFAPNTRELAAPPDTIVGHSLEELLPPPIAEDSRRTLQKALTSGRVETHEYVLDLPDGQQHFEARHVANGADEVLAIVRNITRRKRNEEALRRSEASFRTLIESSPDLVVVHRQGRVVYANECGIKLLGYDSPEQIVGSPVIDLVHAEDRPVVAERIRHMMETGEPVPTREERILCRDGSTIIAEVAAIPLEFRGEPAVIVVAHDVTARKRAEQERVALEAQIQHAQKLESLGVLAGGIAHDFNNLLMGVLGNAGLALMQLPHESPARESLRRIEAAGRRAADLTRQLLAYSGKGKFVVEPIDLSRLVDEMIHLLHTVISKRATLRLNLAAGLLLVDADPAQVCQVVMNLITNASDAIGETSGVITVTTGSLHADRLYLTTTLLNDQLSEGCYVYLEVSDTGQGMEPATVARIFDPFFTTKFAGRGLGLAAVMGIVRGHHGAIKVYTEPGQGTTFKVLLPCSASTIEPLSTPQPPSAPLTQRYTVLVVDDDEVARSAAQGALEHFGFDVMTANDGAEAVQAVRDHGDEIDIVLLDMTMPVMGGAEAFREMRRIRAEVRVILTSGYNEQDAIHRFAGKGLAGFIQKPYAPEELVDKIRRILGR